MTADTPGPPRPPDGLKAAGQRLWTSVLQDYELEEHERVLLQEMARTADQLDALAAIVVREGVIDSSGRAHPALVESRQMKIAFARLAGALRLPAGDAGDHQQDARRPQRRVGVRGTYLRGVS